MSAIAPAAGGRRFVLAAGGTGGHLFPAQSLAEHLVAAGARVYLATDRRADAFAAAVPGVEIRRVAAGRLGGSALQNARGLAAIAIGIVQARRLLQRLDPDAVIGFGGYPSIPTMLAAARLGYPSLLHEQNAVLGRANRFLRKRVGRIATGFRETGGLRAVDRLRATYTGNPVRPAIRAVGEAPYCAPTEGGPVDILVLGGSQGARIFADTVPPALAALPPGLRARLRLCLQARAEDCDRVSLQLHEAGIVADVRGFFADVPERLARAHFVICRAGASTVAELAAAGRPALLVPYPFATDDHQLANARAFANAGAGWVIPQAALSAPMLATVLADRLADPASLALAAVQARGFACDDAVERLAALVLDLLPALGRRRAREERAA